MDKAKVGSKSMEADRQHLEDALDKAKAQLSAPKKGLGQLGGSRSDRESGIISRVGSKSMEADRQHLEEELARVKAMRP